MIHLAVAKTFWIWNPSVKPAWLICATLKTTLTLSSVKPSQSSPESVSMQAASPNHGGILLFVVRMLTIKKMTRHVYLNALVYISLTLFPDRSHVKYSCLIVTSITLKCLSPQTKNVLTTWSSQSVAALALTAAPTLRPARHVTVTARMAAVALLVSTHILYYICCIQMKTV